MLFLSYKRQEGKTFKFSLSPKLWFCHWNTPIINFYVLHAGPRSGPDDIQPHSRTNSNHCTQHKTLLLPRALSVRKKCSAPTEQPRNNGYWFAQEQNDSKRQLHGAKWFSLAHWGDAKTFRTLVLFSNSAKYWFSARLIPLQPELIKGFLSFSTRCLQAIANMIGAFLLEWPGAARRRRRGGGGPLFPSRQPPAKLCARCVRADDDVFFPPILFGRTKERHKASRASERRTLLICECSRRAQ